MAYYIEPSQSKMESEVKSSEATELGKTSTYDGHETRAEVSLLRRRKDAWKQSY